MALVYQTVASQNQNGPLVQSLTDGQMATLAYDYTFNYPAFLSAAGSLINRNVQAIEANEPEGQRNYLILNGWNGEATTAANSINSQWAQGKILGTDGKPVAAWTEFPNQIAWSTNNGNTLELRWLKWEWQLYLLVFVLIAVVGYLVYRVLTQNSWTLQTANEVANPSTPQGASTGLFNNTPLFGGAPFRVFYLPWYWALAATGGIVAGPYIYRQFTSVEESRAKSAEAIHEYRHVKEEE